MATNPIDPPRIHESAYSGPVTTGKPLPRVKGLESGEFMRDYAAPRRPVVLEGATAKWEALRKWTPDFWVERYGDRQVSIDGKNYTLKEVIRRALESTNEAPAPYYRNIVLRSNFPELVTDVAPVPAPCEPNWLRSWLFVPTRLATPKFGLHHELFIGGTGGSFPFLHFDDPGTHTFIHQLFGRKMFIMFSPNDSEFLYPDEGSKFLQSRIKNLDRVDLNEFPLFAKTTPYVAELGPGDTLFIPCGWWHTAKMLTYSVTIGTDLLNHTNWDHFITYQRRKIQFRNRLFGAVYLAYLRTVGLVLRLKG